MLGHRSVEMAAVPITWMQQDGQRTLGKGKTSSDQQQALRETSSVVGFLHELQSTVQHLCTSIPFLDKYSFIHCLSVEPERAAPPLPIVSPILWSAAIRVPSSRSGEQAQWCVLGKPTWEHSQQDYCSRAYSHSHLEASSLSEPLLSPLPGRKYHEWLMQGAVGSSLPALFASTEHAPVVCFVFSVSLCPYSLCIASRLGVMVWEGRSFPSGKICTADAQISVLYIRKLLHATLQAWWQTSSSIFQGTQFMIFSPSISQKWYWHSSLIKSYGFGQLTF